MRATRLVITLLAFLPSLFIIKADETELTEMRLVSDSLIYMIQSNVDCDSQKKICRTHIWRQRIQRRVTICDSHC